VLRDVRSLLSDDLADLAAAFTQVLHSLATEARDRAAGGRLRSCPPARPASRDAAAIGVTKRFQRFPGHAEWSEVGHPVVSNGVYNGPRIRDR
jgi:hypothetical protein